MGGQLMDTVKIELTAEEVNGILTVLAELPTKTGAWPLFTKIQQQAQEQMGKKDNPSSG